MADMLSGIYAPAEQGERWSELVLATAGALNTARLDGATRRQRTVEQEINDLHPRFEPDLAAAEGFFTGPGSLDDLSQYFD
ncbi:hypothetical protein ACFWVC_25025 [Streptomyces sp. NPDC058691]|uniref:hypothetical protein n=1 Tax=Streptomyces sp. NPDC058691 TaxID=3346601 RepID=UPI00364DD88D